MSLTLAIRPIFDAHISFKNPMASAISDEVCGEILDYNDVSFLKGLMYGASKSEAKDLKKLISALQNGKTFFLAEEY